MTRAVASWLRTACLLLVASTSGASAQDCGDCDENGSFTTILDALVGAQLAASIGTPTPNQSISCDVDSSCVITVLDALLMAQDAAGVPVSLACKTLGLPVPPTCGDIVISEIHFHQDPMLGDANCDGITSTDDEFVEIVNVSCNPILLTDVTIEDGVGVRHTFAAGVVVGSGQCIVVFGDVTLPSPMGCTFGGSQVEAASSGTLGLNNTGDNVSIRDAMGVLLHSQSWPPPALGPTQALIAFPEPTRCPGVPCPVVVTMDWSSNHCPMGCFFTPGTTLMGSATW